jgi:predicted phosphodiesterase
VTRWAFVSDIHGNRTALATAEELAHARAADRFVCLGDVIGRGDPGGCVQWVRDQAELAIVGNRDLDYIDRVPPELQATVRTWASEVAASDFIASHGEPRLHRVLNSAAEQDGFRRARAYLTERGARVWFFGHTHRSRAWRLLADRAEPLADGAFDLDPSSLYVVNVGTTGLPLPGRGPASFVIYDDAAHRIERVPLKPDAIVRPIPRRSVPVRV